MYKKDSITLENIQKKATRLVNSLSGRTYEDRLKYWDFLLLNIGV